MLHYDIDPKSMKSLRCAVCFNYTYILCYVYLILQEVLFTQALSLISPAIVKNDLHPNLLKVKTHIEEVEEAHVTFLTPLRHKRDIYTREFHIIRIKRKSPKKNLEIHLAYKNVTSHDFKAVVSNGNDNSEIFYQANDNEDVNCIFEGHVLVDGNNIGKAALSSCGDEAGFRGMILSQEEHFVIEPQEVFTDESFENTNSIPHLLIKTSPEQAMKNTVTDEMHVPYNQLVEAAELEKQEESSRHDHPRTEPKVVYSMIDESESASPILLSTDPDLDHENDEARNESEEVMSLRMDSSSRSQSNRKKPRVPKNNVKRQATESSGKAIVEIAVFTDPDFYNQMKIRYPKDTLKKIKEYIMTMVNAMDMLYEQKSLETDLIFKLVHLEILKKWPTKLNKHGGKAKSFLTSFCDYAGDLNENNELWDHALMLTGADLREEGTSATAGLAWAGTMCFRYYSCSISEGTQFGSVYIITHEIGHSMGMEHDGDGVSSKCDKEKYIMSPTTGPGKVTWSSCSSKNLQDFLKFGTSELRGSRSATKPSCLSESIRQTKTIEYSNGELPGVKYSPTKQCALALGKRFTPVTRKDSPFNNVCWMLYCGNTTHAVSTHPALEGSDCGKGKHCRGGSCVNKT